MYQAMFLKFILAVSIVFYTVCVASRSASALPNDMGNTKRFLLMESHIPRETFVQGERSLGTVVHEVVIAVQQKNLAELKQQVYNRATPGHPMFQKWFSFQEIGEMVQNKEGYSKVKEWLDAFGVQITWSSPYQEYIRAAAPISTWEEMLSTQFFQFEDLTRTTEKNSESKEKILHRALDYSIPAELKDYISVIFHTVQTPPRFRPKYQHRILKEHKPRRSLTEESSFKSYLRFRDRPSKESHSNAGSGVDLQQTGADVTVSWIDSYYKVNSNIASPRLNQSVFETDNEEFSQNDLLDFQNTYHLTVQQAQDIGGHQTSSCTSSTCGEGNLDIQYIMGMAQKTASIYWYVPATGDPFVTWITDVAADPYPPQSNSLSWGEVEQLTGSSTVNQWENEAMKLAGRGVTISVSSGDDGAPNIYGSTCLCSGVSVGGQYTSNGYNPSFPATSEWVTAVGATMGPETGGPEVTCTSNGGGVITSGGGFSNYVSQPNYQTNALNYYFAHNSPPSGYNRNGRGYPDVSLIGVNYQVIIGGQTYTVYGTSCSSPVFASFVTLVNSARLESNLPAIGFINPLLYSVGYNNTVGLPNKYNASFNDVTAGENNCCASSVAADAVCCSKGFTAVNAWDPATGWGSIDYTDFAAIFSVVAPYTPPPSNANSSNSITSLSTTEIAIIVLIILAIVAALFFLYSCCARQRRLAAENRQQQQPSRNMAINTSYAVPATVAAHPVGHTVGTYAAPQNRF